VTVCVAALAVNGRTIICVADKAISYGEQIQWDSDSTKIVKLNPSGSLVMFSGDEQATQKVLANMLSVSDQIKGKTKAELIKLCEEQFKDAVDDLIVGLFLKPRLLTKEDYINAITGTKINDMMRSLADEIKKYEVDCGLLVCGFDVNHSPFILSVSSPGVVTDMTHTGFHAIGSGWDKAVSRLLFSEHKRDHALARVLYDAFDAKANAEMESHVGYEWDAVVSLDGPVEYCDIGKEIKELVERTWVQYNRSPFDKYNPKEDVEPPPKNWKKRLETLIDVEVLTRMREMSEEEIVNYRSSRQPLDSQTSTGQR
jgi:hypothetical protein